MKTRELSLYVEECLNKEDSRVHFMKRLEEMANAPGHTPTARDAECISVLAVDYLRAVVGMLGECEKAAHEMGAKPFADPLIRIAAKYFMEPDDLIPDELGLYGLIDDAYLAHRFIIELSGMVKAEKGFPLIPSTQEESIIVIRSVIGEEIVEKLEAKIDETIHSFTVRRQMAQLSMLSGTLPTHDSALWAKVKADRERIAWRPKDS